jgi:hypothetical protein
MMPKDLKTERFEMRWDRETLARIDKWRSKHPDEPSRAEAIRRLVISMLDQFDRDTKGQRRDAAKK